MERVDGTVVTFLSQEVFGLVGKTTDDLTTMCCSEDARRSCFLYIPLHHFFSVITLIAFFGSLMPFVPRSTPQDRDYLIFAMQAYSAVLVISLYLLHFFADPKSSDLEMESLDVPAVKEADKQSGAMLGFSTGLWILTWAFWRWQRMWHTLCISSQLC